MFAVFSYIAPTVTEVGGLPDSAVPVFLLAFGLGHGRRHLAGRRAGRLVGLPLAARRVGRHGRGAARLLRPGRPARVVGRFRSPSSITVLGSVLVINLQLRLMDVAGEAQTLGAEP